jgi:AAA15 family ATPase/GTPase
MELVYLWVEDYKNIKKQGFNFSPRFECEFKAEYEKDKDGKEKLKDDCQLVIKPKEHIENFFGENINITAIVGENGSGKSSVL